MWVLKIRNNVDGNNEKIFLKVLQLFFIIFIKILIIYKNIVLMNDLNQVIY